MKHFTVCYRLVEALKKANEVIKLPGKDGSVAFHESTQHFTINKYI